ncbi:MAG TPA: DNA double-strand break repair nuclease NurA, partial [Pyrinomonadaceae bacterium]|nr:DNA double-strand break repair nuclease NurA [Pyrinomonadaceae bacterium]
MLYRELLVSELQEKSESFKTFALEQTRELSQYLEKLSRFCRTPYAEISARLEGAENCGAIPSEEFGAARSFSFSFNQSWRNHEEARAWAFEVLQNRTTFAADGSQLFAEREVSLPVAAIQIGWFENPHNDGVGYEKQAYFKVLAPDELLSQDEPVIPETKVGQRRFEEEIETVKKFLEKKRGWRERGERMPLAFYDGTLLLSIAMPKTDLQEGFIKKL